MVILLSWLNELVGKQLKSNQVLGALEAAGIEVEEVRQLRALDSKLVVAEVMEVKPHPSADKLKMALLSTGNTRLEVVCGAPNLAAGQKVVLAQVGTKLPDGTKIKASTIRGQKSNGMLCSEHELGLSDNHNGILVLEETAELGQPVKDIFGAEETVIDISTAANRPDLLGLEGVAREVAVRAGLPTSRLEVKPTKFVKANLVTKTKLSGYSRYGLLKLDIPRSAATSPHWLRQRLQLVGVRPINLVVDVTNYVLQQTGQPLHAFDASKIHGQLGVRYAKAGEKIKTLDGEQRSLAKADLVIADKNKAVAIAGIMGGQDTEVGPDTRQILLEAATFDGASVRKTAQSLGLRTEASARFERNLPAQFVDHGLTLAVELLKQLAGAKVIGYDEAALKPAKAQPIKFEVGSFGKLMGLPSTVKLPLKQLQELGFSVKSSGNFLVVTPPYWRPDVELAEDIYEELIKLIGLEQVPSSLPALHLDQARFDDFWPKLWQLRSALTGLGQFEVTTYPFVSEQSLQTLGFKLANQPKLQNPRSPQQTYLRPSLLPSFLAAAGKNSPLRPTASMYEIANVFKNNSSNTLPKEELKLASLSYGKNAYVSVKAALESIAQAMHSQLKLELRLIADYLHPRRQAAVMAGSKKVGLIGELHPRVLQSSKLREAAYLELDVNSILEGWEVPQLYMPPHHPPAKRDLTVVVDTRVSYQAVAEVLDNPMLSLSFGGDFYSQELGKDKKALSLHLEFNSPERTLKEVEITEAENKVLKSLQKHFGAVKKD